jgi:hypothetical protein
MEDSVVDTSFEVGRPVHSRAERWRLKIGGNAKNKVRGSRPLIPASCLPYILNRGHSGVADSLDGAAPEL